MKTGFVGLGLVAGFICAPALAQRDFSDVEIRTEHVAGKVHVLYGAGGNIGVLVDEDGIVLIDDQFAPLTDRILEALKALSPGPVRFLVNTHWHGDHTGGNENLGRQGVLILAHDHVHERLANPQRFENASRNRDALPREALPTISYNDSLSLHLGEEVRAVHYPHAHTDGDSILYFKTSNAVHMGDIFFAGRYPFIDIASGGNLLGVIAAVADTLERIGDSTRVIPGHGEVTDRAALAAYLAMLETARDRVGAMIAEGRTLEEVKAARPMADHDDVWGSGFINPESFLEQVYRSLRTDN